MKQNKSQIFLLDLIFAFTLLLAALGLFFFYFSNITSDPDLFEFNRDLMNTFTGTNINALNNPEVREMFVDNRIKNVENSVAQQIAEFYYMDQESIDSPVSGELSRNLTRAFVGSFITSPELVFNITIMEEGGSPVSLFSKENPSVSRDEAQVVSTTTRDVIGFYNLTTPFKYTFKIELWV